MTGCTCDNVAMGSYANQDAMTPPWDSKPVGIDRCIRPEIERLWASGIRTVESCCGHGLTTGYIAVRVTHNAAMVAMGYRRDPDAPHVFLWPQAASVLSPVEGSEGTETRDEPNNLTRREG